MVRYYSRELRKRWEGNYCLQEHHNLGMHKQAHENGTSNPKTERLEAPASARNGANSRDHAITRHILMPSHMGPYYGCPGNCVSDTS